MIRPPRPSRSAVALAAAAAYLVATATMASATPTSTAQTACLARTPQVVTTGPHTTWWPVNTVSIPNNAGVNTTGSTFTTTPTANQWPVVFKDVPGTRANICMVGGFVTSTYPTNTPAHPGTATPWAVWHGTTAVEARTDGFSSINLKAENVGDGISFTRPNPTPGVRNPATPWKITGAQIIDAHDDCIEDDGMASGTVDDSYLQCFSGFSAQGYSHNLAYGVGNTVTVKNTLVYIKQMPTKYTNAAHPVDGPGIGTLFKWSEETYDDGYSPGLVLENVTIRLDEAPQWYGNVDLPPRYTEPSAPTVKKEWPITCTNVKILWTGAGAYPGTIGASCPVTFITLTQWNAEVATYNAAHP